VITRPAHQAEPLAQQIRQLGGQALIVPMLEILPLADPSNLLFHLQQINCYHYAIFVSANAVDFALSNLEKSCFFSPNFLNNTQIIAIGPGTARALQKYNIDRVIIPDENHSEGLLSLESLQNIQRKKIIIFCGENSRSLIKNTLINRKAFVEEVICYRRCPPKLNAPAIIKDWQKMNINLIISTSSESLGNLWNLFGKIDKVWLMQIPLLVISPQMLTTAQQMGFKKIWLSPSAADATILKTIEENL